MGAISIRNSSEVTVNDEVQYSFQLRKVVIWVFFARGLKIVKIEVTNELP